jgi:hypothetical protein
LGTVLMISLMYRRKKVVERVLPWGMPCVMVFVVDCACCVVVVVVEFILKHASLHGNIAKRSSVRIPKPKHEARTVL